MKDIKHKEDLKELRKKVNAYRKMKPFIELKECLMIALFTMPYAFVVNKILVPHNIVSGGLTGICEIIYFATNCVVPIWLSTLILNTILLVIAIYLIGWRFCLRTIYGVLCLTIWFKIIPITETPMITDPFMAIVLGGLLSGLGLGIIFLNNGTTGGTDIIAMIINKYKHISLGRILFSLDLIIISSAYFLPNVHSVERILFGLCYTFMEMIAVDGIMNRVRQSVQFFIYSQHYQEIADAIMTQVPRGVTFLEGMGGYSKKPVKIITVLARRNEASKIFSIVRMIDPEAFISETQTEGVFGRGFDPIRK